MALRISAVSSSPSPLTQPCMLTTSGGQPTWWYEMLNPMEQNRSVSFEEFRSMSGMERAVVAACTTSYESLAAGGRRLQPHSPPALVQTQGAHPPLWLPAREPLAPPSAAAAQAHLGEQYHWRSDAMAVKYMAGSASGDVLPYAH